MAMCLEMCGCVMRLRILYLVTGRQCRAMQTQEQVIRTLDRSNLGTVKPATYDGSGLWNDYLSHFESVCLLNEWSETEKGLYLAASLRGLAQGVL